MDLHIQLRKPRPEVFPDEGMAIDLGLFPAGGGIEFGDEALAGEG
jgi:hypothetical protein